MAQKIIAEIQLSPGEVGYYDEYSKIYLTRKRPNALIYDVTDTTQIKRSIQYGRLKLVSGSLEVKSDNQIKENNTNGENEHGLHNNEVVSKEELKEVIQEVNEEVLKTESEVKSEQSENTEESVAEEVPEQKTEDKESEEVEADTTEETESVTEEKTSSKKNTRKSNRRK